MKTKKIILIAVAVAVVVGGGIWFFTGSPAKHKVMYASATVSKGENVSIGEFYLPPAYYQA